jgi:hypothetical protein
VVLELNLAGEKRTLSYSPHVLTCIISVSRLGLGLGVRVRG